MPIPKFNRNNHFFQPNYYDHIIRNNKSYKNISEYIINNPLKWDDDKFNLANNESVRQLMKQEKLRELAVILTER